MNCLAATSMSSSGLKHQQSRALLQLVQKARDQVRAFARYQQGAGLADILCRLNATLEPGPHR